MIDVEALEEAVNTEPEELAIFTSPEEKVIAQRIIPILADKANSLAEAKKAKELEREVNELKAANKQAIESTIEQIKAENKPITPADIEKVVSQEYAEITVSIKGRKGDQSFVIRELPQAVELKFIKNIQKTLVPRMKELASIDWTNGTTAERLQRVIDMLPETMELLAENCAICLDPFGDLGTNKEWVQANMSSFRIFSVIEAQIMVGKFRDLFLSVSRSIST